MKKRGFKYQIGVKHRANEKIWAQKVRLIGSDGKQVGVVGREEMLEKARAAGLDAVEVVAKANPPVVRLLDYSKFKYAEDKKAREERRKWRKASELKEVRFTPFIGDEDFRVRIERIKEFLKEGHKVRLVVRFRGRQMAHKEFGYQLTQRILRSVAGKAKVDKEPKFLGLRLISVIAADTEIKEEKKDEKEQTKNKKVD